MPMKNWGKVWCVQHTTDGGAVVIRNDELDQPFPKVWADIPAPFDPEDSTVVEAAIDRAQRAYYNAQVKIEPKESEQ